jgi:hypothetical protein
MKMKRFFSLILCSLVLAGSFAAAEGAAIVSDEDALFGGDESTASGDSGIDAVDVSSKGAAVATFLKTDAVRVGGSFSPYIQADWMYLDPWNGSASIAKPDYQSLTPVLPALVFIDARPKDDFRVYFSVKADWPFTNTSTTNTTTGLTTTDANVRVFELFSDFNLNDAAFFRFGKQTVKWGVGYFFSPSDIFNLTAIDVTDPTAQREGPVGLRVNIPVPGRQDNIWAYAIVPNEIASSDLEPADTGFAGRYELVVGGWELSLGGAFQRAIDPRIMLTASGSVGAIGLFGEVVPALDSSGVRISSTAGLSYTGCDGYLSAYAQYYYNDEAALVSRRQYGAVSITRSNLINGDFSVGMLMLSNLSDLSFVAKPSITWAWLDYSSLSFGPVFTFASDALWGKGSKGEYVASTGGPSLTLSVKAVLGSGKF